MWAHRKRWCRQGRGGRPSASRGSLEKCYSALVASRRLRFPPQSAAAAAGLALGSAFEAIGWAAAKAKSTARTACVVRRDVGPWDESSNGRSGRRKWREVEGSVQGGAGQVEGVSLVCMVSGEGDAMPTVQYTTRHPMMDADRPFVHGLDVRA